MFGSTLTQHKHNNTNMLGSTSNMIFKYEHAILKLILDLNFLFVVVSVVCSQTEFS